MIINIKDGVIDQSTLLFNDFIGPYYGSNNAYEKGIPYLWQNNGKFEWYKYIPTQDDYNTIFDMVKEYLDLFRGRFVCIKCGRTYLSADDSVGYITSITQYHYINTNGKVKNNKAVTHHFTPGSEDINHKACLMNTCCDETGFETIPDNVSKWIEEIGLDFGHFPNLTKLWGENRSEYALTLRYELAHEHVSKNNIDYPVILPYDEQLKLLLKAAAEIAKAIPHATVRLFEMAACHNQHELEIAFIYPCAPEIVLAGYEILEIKFDYIWDIGREPRD